MCIPWPHFSKDGEGEIMADYNEQNHWYHYFDFAATLLFTERFLQIILVQAKTLNTDVLIIDASS